MMQRSQIELLAPAGDEECFKAAIAAGADAVYFGLEQFSARTRAKNLTINQAEYMIPLAHKHNVRTYLTLNTLITDEEIQTALSLVEKAVNCGIDAVIIQDLGVLNAVHQIFPDLEIHASTQMTTHNLSQCKYLSELGVSQINLSRELSLSEIQNITEYLHSQNIVPEIFVQGAFCISYSGQCYLSGHLYNQAGNRGDCVQPCRRCWSSQAVESKALFHLKDNSAFPLADKLIKENYPLSLKIEGRIKNAEYVWAVTSAWREQIDLILSQKQILKTSPKLNGAINRDYTCGYLEGNISSQMFSSGTKDISQIKIGTVKNYIADSKNLILNNPEVKLNKGDRLTIKTSSEQFICTANVTDKLPNGYKIQITNKLTKKILSGQIIYKSSSVITPEELAKIINTISDTKTECHSSNSTEKLFDVNISVKAVKNQPLEITYESNGKEVTVKSEQILAKAENAGLTDQTLQQKLTKLGGTSFTAKKFKIEKLDSSLFIPLGELNNLRRKAVELLQEKLNSESDSIYSEPKIAKPKLKLPQTYKNEKIIPVNAYLIDSQKDLEQFLLKKQFASENKSQNYKIIYELPSAINLINSDLFNLINNNPEVVLFFNSILMDEDLKTAIGFLNKLTKLSNREILCSNTGLAFELKDSGCKIILGPECNIYNSFNIEEYNKTLNIKGFIPSLELPQNTVENLKIPENLEIWYPKDCHKLLMQSRQCLVRNGSGCGKNHVDRTCLENCSKKIILKGTQAEQIMAVKRPGFYSALFTADKVSVTSSFLKDKVTVWITDKRF